MKKQRAAKVGFTNPVLGVSLTLASVSALLLQVPTCFLCLPTGEYFLCKPASGPQC